MFKWLRKEVFKVISFLNRSERRYDKIVEKAKKYDKNGNNIPDVLDEIIEEAKSLDNETFFYTFIMTFILGVMICAFIYVLIW